MTTEYDAFRSDPDMRRFVNCLRECLGLGPLYDRGRPTDAERFYIEPHSYCVQMRKRCRGQD